MPDDLIYNMPDDLLYNMPYDLIYNMPDDHIYNMPNDLTASSNLTDWLGWFPKLDSVY